MERLTRKMCGGWGVIPGYELSTVKGMKAVVDRLAAYEDTWLEPEEIDNILDAYGRGMTLRTESVDRLRTIKGITSKRLEDLARAEKDGRLVVLPCKNDTVYTIKEDYFNCAKCRHGDSAYYQAQINKVSCDINNGVHCPLYVEEHKVDGFEVGFDTTGLVVLSDHGEFGYEGLETFSGIDGKVYYTRAEAEAALKKREEADNEID